MINDVNNKSKEKLLEEFSSHTSHNTLEGEQYMVALIVKSATDIGKSADNIGERITLLAKVETEVNISLVEFKKAIEKSNNNSEKISQKLLWLNWVLTIATTIGALATAILVFK